MTTSPAIDLKALTGESEAPSVSIYMPTHQSGSEIQQDSIRFKNLLQSAEKQLVEHGVREPEIKKMLAPAYDLMQTNDAWRQPKGGFVAFIAPGRFEHYKVPIVPEETLTVGNRFTVRPLLPMLNGDGHFYILALSQDHVRLLEGTRHMVHEVNLEHLPKGLQEVLGTYDFEPSLQHHSVTTASQSQAAGRSAVFHGHGGKEQDDKEKILEYFRQIDKGLHEFLKGRNAPLVVAGVDYLFPIYKEANTYPHLMEDAELRGNPDRLSAKELHSRAWSVVSPRFTQPQREAAEQYRKLAGTGRTSNDIHEILPAASEGRIESLFINMETQQWGMFDAGSRTVELKDGKENGAADLLEEAAVHAISSKARVFAVKNSELPEDVPAAAVFRY